MKKEETPREPIIVKALKDNVAKWSLVPGSTVFLKLKNMTPLKTMIISPKSAGIFETHELFMAPLPVKGLKEEAKSETHIRLMGYEVELKWKGFLSNKPIFNHHSRLSRLSSLLPSLVIRDDLVKKLNEDAKLLGLIKKVKPEEFTVTMMEVTPPTRTLEEYVARLLDYVRNIEEVAWIIKADVYLDRAMKYTWNARATMDITRHIAKYIKTISA